MDDFKREKVQFIGSTGAELSGIISFPVGEVRAYVIFAHCFTCTKNFSIVSTISNKLNAEGYAILRFDFTGLGQSKGDFEDTNFSTNSEDLIIASKFLADNYEAPQLIVGHSLGGAAVLNVAGKIDSIKAVATIGAPAEPIHVSHLFSDYMDELMSGDETVVLKIAGREHKFKKQFIIDLKKQDLTERIGDLHKPLMIFHSPLDTIVEIDNAKEIYQAANHPKSFISLGKADHLLSKKEDANFVADVLAHWAHYYIQ